MRELGGYMTNDGEITQWKRFIRSSHIINLSDNDIDFLYNYGVRTVVDLRGESEITESPSALSQSEGILYRNIPFTDDYTYFGDINYCPLHHIVPAMKREHRVCEILTEFANAPKGGIIFNCSAGKDRTGIIAVLLLLLANVPIEDIVADYQVTYTYSEKMDRDVDLYRTEPEWIVPFINFVLEHGGITEYLIKQNMRMADIKILKERLIHQYEREN